MNRIRVIFIIWSYTYGGGAESLLTTIVNSLNPDKYDISIIELVHADAKVELVNDNIHILPYITEEKASDRTEKMFDVLHRPWKIFNEYIGDGYDIYISFNYQRPSFLLQPNKKNIAWIHGDVYDLLDCKMTEERIWQDATFFKCNKIVAISDRTEMSLKTLFHRHEDRIIKIYNGIDATQIINKSLLDCDVKVENNSICFVGRLDENKNPLRALKIFIRLHDLMPETHMYYLGDGVLRDELVSAVYDNGLGSSVHVIGYIKNPFPIIKQCKAMLHTSLSEGFQIALLEGLVLGIPFVSTDVGASRLLSDGQSCGIIFDTDNDAVDALKGYLYLSSDKLDEIKSSCSESWCRFNINRYIEKVEKLIDSVVEE